MTRYLLQPPPEVKADAPIVWTCLVEGCAQTVEDLWAHTRSHNGSMIEIFESQAALDRALREESRRMPRESPERSNWIVFDSISRMKYPGFDNQAEAQDFVSRAGLQQTSIHQELQ